MDSSKNSASFNYADPAATGTPRFPYMARWKPSYERNQIETSHHPSHNPSEFKPAYLSQDSPKHHRPHSCPSLPSTYNLSRLSGYGALTHLPLFDVGFHGTRTSIHDENQSTCVTNNMADSFSSFSAVLGEQKSRTLLKDFKPNMPGFHGDDIVEPHSPSFVGDGISPLLKLVKLVKGSEPFSWPRGSGGSSHHPNMSHTVDSGYLLPDSTCPDEQGPGLQISVDSIDLWKFSPEKNGVKCQKPLADFSGTESPLHSDVISVESFGVAEHLVKSPTETRVGEPEVKTEPTGITIDRVKSLASSEGARAKNEPVDFVVDTENKRYDKLGQIKSTSSGISAPPSEKSRLSPADVSVCPRNGEVRSEGSQQLFIGRFKCLFCAFACNHKLVLELHAAVHASSPPFSCSHCQLGSFSSCSEYNEHILLHAGKKYSSEHIIDMNHHYKHQRGVQPQPMGSGNSVPSSSTKFRHRCRTCPFVTGDFEALNMHKMVHRQAPPYNCSRCDAAQFWSAKEFSIHVLMHVDEAKFFCKLKNCLYVSKHSSNVLRHYRLKHNRKHSMSLLGVGQVNGDLPQRPLDPSNEVVPLTSENSSTKRFRCKKCGFSSQCLKKWRLHWLKHTKRHKTLRRRRSRLSEVESVAMVGRPESEHEAMLGRMEKEQDRCELCDFKCVSREALKLHVDQIHRIKKCTQCSYSTVDWKQYQAHVEGHVSGKLLSGDTSADDDGEYICESCEFRCRELTEWKAHKCCEKKRETNIVSTLKRMVYDLNTYPSIKSAQCASHGHSSFDFSIVSSETQCRLEKGFNPHQTLWNVPPIDGDNLLCSNKLKGTQSHTMTAMNGQCSDYTLSEASLQKNMARMPSNCPAFCCRLCGFSSGDKSCLFRHVRSKHNIFDMTTVKRIVEVSGANLETNTGFYQEAIGNLCSSLPNPSHQIPMELRSNPVRNAAFDPLLKSGETRRHSDFGERLTDTRSSNVKTTKNRDEQRRKEKSHKDRENTEALTTTSTPGYGEKLANILCSGFNDIDSDDSSSDTDISMFTAKPRLPEVVEEGMMKGLLITSISRVNGIIVPLYKCEVCGNQSHVKQDIISHIRKRHQILHNDQPRQVTLAQLHQRRSGKTRDITQQFGPIDKISTRQLISLKRPFADSNSSGLSSHWRSGYPNLAGQDPCQPFGVQGLSSGSKVNHSAGQVAYNGKPLRPYAGERKSGEDRLLVHGTIDPATIEIVSDSEDSDN